MKGDEYLQVTHKKPGHCAKKFDINTRIDKDAFEMLEYCKQALHLNRSETIRRGIHILYKDLCEKEK